LLKSHHWEKITKRTTL